MNKTFIAHHHTCRRSAQFGLVRSVRARNLMCPSKTRPLIRTSLEAFSAGCGRKCRRHHQQRNEEVGAGVASRPRVGHGRPLTGPECGPLAPVPCCPPDSRPGVSRPAICTRRKVRSDSPGMTSVQSTFTAILAATYESSIYVW
jgi:hypothetical protein